MKWRRLRAWAEDHPLVKRTLSLLVRKFDVIYLILIRRSMRRWVRDGKR
jgi:hypothetical protein